MSQLPSRKPGSERSRGSVAAMARRTTLIGLVAALAVAACSSGEAQPMDSPTTTRSPLAEYVSALHPDIPVIQSTIRPGRSPLPQQSVEVWADGRYRVTFGDPTLIYGGVLPNALRGASVEGSFDPPALEPYLTGLMRADIEALAASVEDGECGVELEMPARSYTLTTPVSSRKVDPCLSQATADLPAPLDVGAALIDRALDEQRNAVNAYLGYGSALDTMAAVDWRRAGLVGATIAEMDVESRSMELRVDDVLAGNVAEDRYEVAAAAFDDLRPDEETALAAAAAGDRVLALIDEGGGVRHVGFLDAAGALLITGSSGGVFSLGHAAEVASDFALFEEITLTCPLSQFARPNGAALLGPMEAITEVALRERAAVVRTDWIREETRLPRVDTIFMAFTKMTPDEVVVVTDPDGHTLAHARPDERLVAGAEAHRVQWADALQVWTLPAEHLAGCHRAEFGLIAQSRGRLVVERPGDQLSFDRSLGFGVNIKRGRVGIGP